MYSICKHTVRLAYDRNELDLHPDLDFRAFGRQAKRGMCKKIGAHMIGILDFNYTCGFGYFVLLVMLFGGVIIRLFK